MTDTLPVERLTALANELLTVLMRCTNVEYASSILLQYQEAAREAALTEAETAIVAAMDRNREEHPDDEAMATRRLGMRAAERVVWSLRLDGGAR